MIDSAATKQNESALGNVAFYFRIVIIIALNKARWANSLIT